MKNYFSDEKEEGGLGDKFNQGRFKFLEAIPLSC